MARPNLGALVPFSLARTISKPSDDLVAAAKTPWKAAAVVRRLVRGNRWSDRRKRSDSQPLAALRTAGIDDPTPTDGFHAGAKTMGAHALDLAGLICSFHGMTALEPVYKRGKMLKQPLAPCQCLPATAADRLAIGLPVGYRLYYWATHERLIVDMPSPRPRRRLPATASKP